MLHPQIANPTQCILNALQSILTNQNYPDGRSIYLITATQSTESQPDESAITHITIKHNDFKNDLLSRTEQQKYDDLEIIAFDNLLSLTPNACGLNKIYSDTFKRISPLGASILWQNDDRDTLFIQGTDASIYIQFIQSGQY